MKLIHGAKLALFTAILGTANVPKATLAVTLEHQKTNQQTLETLYYQRDYQSVITALDVLDSPLNVSEQLLVTAIKVQRNEDNADDALASFTKAHPNNAKVQYWAGNLWKIVAKNSSMFSKVSIYSHYVEAIIKRNNKKDRHL